jgi:hypothetical protein
MGLPVTVYRSTDIGAPQLSSNKPAEWFNILKKCLVEGYGGKLPLGWTIADENLSSHKILFRNSNIDGSGGYVRFSSRDGLNSSVNDILITTAIDAQSVNSLQKTSAQRAIALSNANRGWEIIGTSVGFFITQHNTNSLAMFTSIFTNQSTMFIGDLINPINPTLSHIVLVSGSSGGDASGGSGGQSISNSSSISCDVYSNDGRDYKLKFTTALTYNNTPHVGNGDAEQLNIPHSLIPTPIYGDSLDKDADGILTNNSKTLPYMIGTLPGLYSSSFSGYGDKNWPVDRDMNGVKFTLLRGYYDLRLWINTEVWYD